MNMKINELMDEVMVLELEKLKTSVAIEERKQAVDCLVKLSSIQNDQVTGEISAMEMQNKRKEVKLDTIIRGAEIGIGLALAVTTLLVNMDQFDRGMGFEVDGAFTSFTLKNLISKKKL